MALLEGNGDRRIAPRDLTIQHAPALRDELLAMLGGDGGAVTLDMSRVERLDTATLQVLIAAQRVARDRGRTFQVVQPGAALRDAAERLGLAGALFECARD